MAAEVIVANPATITGSIGVVTGKLVARALKDRLGIGSEALRTNANADAWSVNSAFTDEQRDLVEAEADLFYDDFVRRVAEARALSSESRGRTTIKPTPRFSFGRLRAGFLIDVPIGN